MKNMFAYLTTSPTPNLYDYCCDYIESAHTGQGEMTANEIIYNLCVDYINGGYISDKNKQYLKEIFAIN